jgi:DNA invertase Pin-like site-specific DNA recombinase
VDDANRGAFDVILVEHIDRLARNAADTIRLREQMEFIGVEIHSCASGLVTDMHAGLEGLMSALYLKQLAVHVRRGQSGRVREGLSVGGITYGYAPVPRKAGSASLSGRRPASCVGSLPSMSPAGRRAILRSASTPTR